MTRSDMTARYKLFPGDCLETLRRAPDARFDALITDPPAGIGYMGAGWDSDRGGRLQWVEWLTTVMRECNRTMKPGSHGLVWAIPRTSHWTMTALEDGGFEIRDVIQHLFGTGFPKSKWLDADKTIGTALKPSSEFWILVRKKPEGSITKSHAKHDVGGLMITDSKDGGRWPAHTTIDEQVAEDLGKFAKYFYCAKTNKREREAGCESLPVHSPGENTDRKDGSAGLNNPRAGAGRTGQRHNRHPTVKPLELMRYFVRLISKPDQIIIDPFMGSGSTIIAAVLEGRRGFGFEAEDEYIKVAKARIEYWANQTKGSNE